MSLDFGTLDFGLGLDNISLSLTVKKFNKRLRRKVYHDDFNSRAIEFFPEEIPEEGQKLDEVD